MSASLRILYLGLPLGAVILERAGHSLDAVVLGHPDAPGGRRMRRRREGLVLARPDLRDPDVQALLASRRPDVLLSFFWPRRIPAEVLALPPRGAFGTHPSLLPRHRGPDPYFWALRLGDEVTGVTLHRLEPEYDTGAIVEQVTVPVDPRHTSWTLARALDRPALALLCRCAERLARGEALEGAPQPEAGVSYAPSPDDEELAIDWSEPAEDVLRLVRAAAPEPGARARLGEHEVDVLAARRAKEAPPRALAPAEAYRSSEGVAVVTGEGAVVLERIRGEDGDPVEPGALLGI
jgi:methionyl-tRNA formyltransferase